jgi:hypothetical protein
MKEFLRTLAGDETHPPSINENSRKLFCIVAKFPDFCKFQQIFLIKFIS